MKILFLNNGMTHYYNLVLNRLNKVPGIEFILIVPDMASQNLGEGVYQTKAGVEFKVYELKEMRRFGFYHTFQGLARLLLIEKPDIIIVTEPYLLAFLFEIPVVLAKKMVGSALMLKSIPFQLPRFEEIKSEILKSPKPFTRFSRWFNRVIASLGLVKVVRLTLLGIKKISLNIPDAHVNYVDEAIEILGSYGVKKVNIFVTRNSPDTDLLFESRKVAESEPPILPACERRLIHVGRLVEWKRVDLLIRALSRVKKQYPDAELVVIGNGPQEEALKKLSHELDLEKDIRFPGGIYEPVTLGRYFLSSSIYVLAGMGGLSINEAMCFGLPVICSVCDGTEKKLVRNGYNGLYFKEGDETNLVEKIAYLFGDQGLIKEMGIRSSEIIRNEINIHTVINGYKRALNYVMQKQKD